MAYRVRPEATMGAYGDLFTDQRRYRPLDTVTVTVQGRDKGDDRATIKVLDARLEPYFEAVVPLHDNRGQFQFTAAGPLGVHWIYLYWPDAERHQRYTNFVLDAETAIETGNPDYDQLYPLTRDALQLGRRVFEGEKGRFVGYISGDTWQINGVWLRDWIYQLPAYAYWEREVQCGLDRFLEAQNPDGSMPDGIRRDGSVWRMAVESDVEYILVLGVYGTWKITGDDAWLANALPKLERALAYIQSDDKRWDDVHQLVKRGHTCDTWDFEIHETSDFVGKRFVVATCDQSGYYLAFRAMASMYRRLDDEARAAVYDAKAEAYRQRANELLWDGVKYQHHVHLTPIDHGDFDETAQLAMGNTWAMTRGLADRTQAMAIIDEYRRRHAATGDLYPWWSLQPGYPDELGYYEGAFCQQGGYANGGLMPWVGGELCRASFQNGREAYGLELYNQYLHHLRRTGNRVHVWFWPDGQAGFRTTNEVPYTGWGMAQWLQALIEGLAGLSDESGQMRRMCVAPRWAVTGERDVRAVVRYAASEAYLAYHLQIDDAARTMVLRYTGSGERAELHVLLPDGWSPRAVTLNGAPVKYETEQVAASLYVNLSAPVVGVGEVRVSCS